MPQIDLCFSGWVRGAEVSKATDINGEAVDVSEMPAKELVEKLSTGKLFVTLGDYLYDNHREAEIEIFDYEVHD